MSGCLENPGVELRKTQDNEKMNQMTTDECYSRAEKGVVRNSNSALDEQTAYSIEKYVMSIFCHKWVLQVLSVYLHCEFFLTLACKSFS